MLLQTKALEQVAVDVSNMNIHQMLLASLWLHDLATISR
jgi:hypothetical protein